MAKYRLFYLTNSNNETISFNECDLFAYTPTGLGLSFTNQYIEYNANFIPTDQQVNQSALSSMVLYSAISKQSYISFYNFVGFLNYQPYTLEYTTAAGTYKRICQLNSITKSELDLYGVLNESLIIDYLTPWFNEITQNINQDDDSNQQIEGTGKIYLQNGTNPGAYIYDYIYCWGDNSNSNGQTFVNIFNNSKMFNLDASSPIKIKITAIGTVTNPSWDLYVNGELVQSDGFNITIQPGHSIEISSFPEDQYAVLIDQNGVRSPIYQTQDLTKTNFIEIPSGNSTLIFNVQDAIISWTIRQQYLVV